MTAQEKKQAQNVSDGQFVLRRAVRETVWPIIKVGFVVALFYGALNTPWVQKYVEDLSVNPRSVDFGHKFVGSMIIAAGLSWFLTRFSSLSRGVRTGIWVAMLAVIVGINGWWLRGVYDDSINGSSALTAAYNVIFIGAIVAALTVGLHFARRTMRISD